MNISQLHPPQPEWNCRIGKVLMKRPENVVVLGGVTSHDIPSSRVLCSAVERGLQQAVVMGYDDQGDYYFASNVADGGTIMWLMEVGKRKLLNIAETMSSSGPASA